MAVVIGDMRRSDLEDALDHKTWNGMKRNCG